MRELSQTLHLSIGGRAAPVHQKVAPFPRSRLHRLEKGSGEILVSLSFRPRLPLTCPPCTPETVWGEFEDVQVVSKFRTKEYAVDNLHILDELHSYTFADVR